MSDPDRPRIAIVEDGPDTRVLVAMLLAKRFALDEYATGQAALEGMRRVPPAVALLDISLPDLDGTKLLALMRSDPVLAGIPAIAFTAHSSAADLARLLALGFCEHLAKPIECLDGFVSTVARFANERPARANGTEGP